MPTPATNVLAGLQKATSIGPAAPIGGAPVRNAVDTGVQGLLGTLGLGNDSSQANRWGQLLAAGAPVIKGGPAVEALLKLFEKGPAEIDPVRAALSASKVSDYRAPMPTTLRLPEGVSLPPELQTMPQAPAVAAAREAQAPLMTVAPKVSVPMQAIKSLEELPDVTQAVKSPDAPQWSFAKSQSGGVKVLPRLNATVVTPDEVKKIRSFATFDDAQAAFPKIKRDTLRSIYRGDTWSWVK